MDTTDRQGVPHDHHASPVAAAVQAAHDTLVALYPAMRADLDTQLAGDLAALPDDAARAAGVASGGRAARSILAARAHDGSAATPPVLAPGTAPGQYRPTPPAFAPAVFTHWPAVTPFVLRDADQFRPGRYPALTSGAYASATNEVQSLGRDTSPTRTVDQTIQATFWAAPIWNYWNEITQTVARGADLAATARAFALVNLAFADSVIAFYDAKYHYRIWRPISAIQLGGTDGNPGTGGDVAWNPLATTPADPAYPGAHSVVAQAGALVLERELGSPRHLIVTSEATPGVEYVLVYWLAVALTLVGGWLFARRYERSRSLLTVGVEHAGYGLIIFTVGLGRYFYHGATPS